MRSAGEGPDASGVILGMWMPGCGCCGGDDSGDGEVCEDCEDCEDCEECASRTGRLISYVVCVGELSWITGVEDIVGCGQRDGSGDGNGEDIALHRLDV